MLAVPAGRCSSLQPLTRDPGVEVLLEAELCRVRAVLQRCQRSPAQRAVEDREHLAGEGVEVVADLHVGLEERQGVDDDGVVRLVVRLPQDAQDFVPVVLQHVGLEHLPDEAHLLRAQHHGVPARGKASGGGHTAALPGTAASRAGNFVFPWAKPIAEPGGAGRGSRARAGKPPPRRCPAPRPRQAPRPGRAPPAPQ